MQNENQAEIDELISFLSPRLRELLKRLTKKNRCANPLEQLALLIEERAYGQVQRIADKDAIPLVDVTNLPETLLVEGVRGFRRVPKQDFEIDAPQPHLDTDK